MSQRSIRQLLAAMVISLGLLSVVLIVRKNEPTVIGGHLSRADIAGIKAEIREYDLEIFKPILLTELRNRDFRLFAKDLKSFYLLRIKEIDVERQNRAWVKYGLATGSNVIEPGILVKKGTNGWQMAPYVEQFR